MRNLNELNEHRRMDAELQVFGVVGDQRFGVFVLKSPVDERYDPRVLATTGAGWDHISVSTRDRCPSWEEMEHVRKLFAGHSEVWLQFGLPPEQHVNCHPYCLHWWRPLHRVIRLPPASMVGPREAR